MPILPSFLEYSTIALHNNIYSIRHNLPKYQELTKQEVIECHIDLVYENFAKDRSILKSLNFTYIYDSLKLIKKPLKLTVHFMGALDDLPLFNTELAMLEEQEDWEVELYLPTNIEPGMVYFDCPKYHWFDVDQYDLIPKYDTPKILLMTVKAGKSGQKLTPENKQRALNIVKSKGVMNVIVDGGWAVEDCVDGLRMVSYSSFWKLFLLP